jgi:hypothetical protein
MNIQPSSFLKAAIVAALFVCQTVAVPQGHPIDALKYCGAWGGEAAWNPDTWPGPPGGDPIALGVTEGQVELFWRVVRVGDRWVTQGDSPGVDPIASVILNRAKIQVVGDPPLVVGFRWAMCDDIAVELEGAFAAQWFESARAYIYSGPDGALHVTRHGSEIAITWWRLEAGELVEIGQWRMDATPKWGSRGIR